MFKSFFNSKFVIMCFVTTSSARIAKTARKNILAYKLLKNISATGGSSPFQNLRWSVGKTVKSRLKTKLSYNGENINEGLHCFKTKTGALNYFYYKKDKHKLVPVLIPKGSKYYENNTQIVSNQMILLSNDAQSFDKVAKLIGAKKI